MKIEAINHVSMVVTDKKRADEFYGGVLGLQKHEKWPHWYKLNSSGSTLHMFEVPQAESDPSWFHKSQHPALQVPDLGEVLMALLAANYEPFQMEFSSAQRPVTDPDDDLIFGVGSLFVRDPDGNLIEFVQSGRGIY